MHFTLMPRIYRNDKGDVVIDNEHPYSALATHFGRESITAIGLLPTLITEQRLEKKSDMAVYTFLLRKQDTMQRNVSWNNTHVRVQSRVGYPDQTGTMTLYRNIIGNFSASVAVGRNYIVDCAVRLGTGTRTKNNI